MMAMSKKRLLKQLLFSVIFEISVKICQMSLLKRINTILSYLALIIGSISLEDPHLMQQISFLGQINAFIVNQELLSSLTYITLVLSTIFVALFVLCASLSHRNAAHQPRLRSFFDLAIGGVAYIDQAYQFCISFYLLLLSKVFINNKQNSIKI